MRAALTLALVLLLPLPALAQDARPGLNVRGDARMGLVWSSPDPRLGPAQDGLRLSSRVRLHFQFMGETDGGTQYGVNFSVDRSNNRPTGQSVFIAR